MNPGFHLQCGGCGSDFAVGPEYRGQIVTCPVCGATLQMPSSDHGDSGTITVPAKEPDPFAFSSPGNLATAQTRISTPQTPLELPLPPVGTPRSSSNIHLEQVVHVNGSGHPPTSGNAAVPAAEARTVITSGSGEALAEQQAPMEQAQPHWPSSSDTATSKASPRAPRKKLPASFWLLSLLIPYAIGATVGVLGLLYVNRAQERPPHPLEEIQDQGLYEDFDEGRRRMVTDPNQPLPPQVQPLKLGEVRKFGGLEVLPLEVRRQKLAFEAFRGMKEYVGTEDALVLRLRLKNLSTNVFQPLDPTFNRTFRRELAPYTYLEIGDHKFFGAISDVATERVRGQRFDELLPEQEMETIVTALHDATGGGTVAARAIKAHPEDKPLTWRVQLRRGREEIQLRDGGRKRTTWLTTVVPVTFTAKDVREDKNP